MPENAVRRIKKVFASLLVFGTLLFTSAGPALAASNTIVHGHVDKSFAGYAINVVCRYVPSDPYSVPPSDWPEATGIRWDHVDSNGNYYVEFTKSECDTGEHLYFNHDYYDYDPDCHNHMSEGCYRYYSGIVVNAARNIQADDVLDPNIPENYWDDPEDNSIPAPEYNPLTFILAAVGSIGLFLYFRKRNKNPLLQCSN